MTRPQPVAITAERGSARIAPAPKDRFYIYLLIGQSNMVGRDLPGPEDGQTHPRILMLGTDRRWAPASDPLPHEEGASKGVGPGMSFARVMAVRNEAITIGLVAAAWGGTPIARWSKGADLYEKAVVLAKAAQRDGVLRGVLWQQGESDSYTQELAQAYQGKLVRMIQALRDDLGLPNLPFIMGEIGQFQHPDFAHVGIINATLRDIAGEVPRTGFVSVPGLTHKGDRSHTDTPSQRRMGKAFAEEMIRVQND
jgi:hypothetical protein